MKKATAIVHIGAAFGAAFAEYTAELEDGGELGDTTAQRFVYALEGAVTVEVKRKQHELGVRGFAYIPQGFSHRVSAKGASRIAVIEKNYQKIDATAAPQFIVSNE